MSDGRLRVYLLRPNDRHNLKLQWMEPETGVRRSRMLKTADPDEGERARADLEYELNHGLHAKAELMPWEVFRDKYIDEYISNLSLSTANTYQSMFKAFEELMRPKQISKVNSRTMSLFAAALRKKPTRGREGAAPQTIRSYLMMLRAMMRWGKGQGLVKEMPTFPKVKVPKTRPQLVPQEWFDKIMAAADPVMRVYLLCGWYGGLRLNEAYELRRGRSEKFPWVDEGRIVFPAEFVKAREDQWIPLHQTLQAALAGLAPDGDNYFDFGGITQSAVSHRVITLAKKAGVPLSMHKLRKGFGCRVAQKLGKGNAPILHRLMRHSSMQITMDYYASVDDVLSESINELE